MSQTARTKRTLFPLLLAVLLTGGLALAVAPAADAASWFRLVPECATAKGTPGAPPPVPSLVCALQTFGNISQIILGVTGSLALLMFVYGGFLLVTSGGSQESVSKGKKAITNAVIGILIIMTAGMLIQYGLDKIGISEGYKAIGQRCGTGETINGKEIFGQYVQKKTGELVCVGPKACETVLKNEFKCLKVTGENAAGAGLYCIANLCPQGQDYMCCYQPTAGGN